MKLIFLKLGGSLITDKKIPQTARIKIINRISHEISSALDADNNIRLVIGHGSGSFGHITANRFNTINGVQSRKDWNGFIQVRDDAHKLNQIIINSLRHHKLNVITFAPSSSILSQNRNIISWDIKPIKLAIENNLIPVIYGDVVFDKTLGGTILSTEDLFYYLANELKPDQILIAGEEPGVFDDFPECRNLIPEINHNNFNKLEKHIGNSKYTDVTGGMINKVKTLLDITQNSHETEILIFSAKYENSINYAMSGMKKGTIIRK